MESNAVIDGQFADFKLVRTRGVAQIVVEVPLERASRVLEMFGVPLPSQEVWVAVARLNTPAPPLAGDAGHRSIPSDPARGRAGGGMDEPQGSQSRTPFDEMPRSKQAGILCQDADFISFCDGRAMARADVLDEEVPEDTAAAVRAWCGVQSRSELDSGRAAPVWDALVREFRQWENDQRYGGY